MFMLNKFDKYYFKLMLIYYTGSATFFIMLFLLGQIRIIIDSILATNVSFFVIFKLLMLTLPMHIFVSLPVALILANALVFGNLSSTSEILAIRSFGVKVDVFLKPVFIFAIIVLILTYVDMEIIYPETTLMWREQINKYRVKSIESSIVEKKVSRYQTYKLYAEKIIDSGGTKKFINLYIFDQKKGEQKTIFAKTGFIDQDYKQKGYVGLKLLNGYIKQEVSSKNSKNFVETNFEVMELFFSFPKLNSYLQINEKPLKEIFKEYEQVKVENQKILDNLKSKGIDYYKLSVKDRSKYKIKSTRIYEKSIHFKIGILISTFIFAFTGFSLVKGIKDLNVGKALFVSILVIMFFYIVFMIFTNYIMTKTNLSIPLTYYSSLGILLLVGIGFYVKGLHY